MKNTISKLILFIAVLSLGSLDVDGAYANYLAQVTQGSGISVTGYGTTASPYVITNTSPGSTPTFNNSPSVTLNTSNQLSTTKNTDCTYSVNVITGVSLLNLNSSAQAFLEISSNNSTWTEINRAGITRTLAVALSVGLNETASYNLQGSVPANYWRRIRTSTSGGGTVTFASGQEKTY